MPNITASDWRNVAIGGLSVLSSVLLWVYFHQLGDMDERLRAQAAENQRLREVLTAKLEGKKSDVELLAMLATNSPQLTAAVQAYQARDYSAAMAGFAAAQGGEAFFAAARNSLQERLKDPNLSDGERAQITDALKVGSRNAPEMTPFPFVPQKLPDDGEPPQR